MDPGARHRGAPGRLVRAAAAALCAVLVAGVAPAEGGTGRLSGVVRLGIEGANLDQVGPVVVFLEALDAVAARAVAPDAVQIRQKNARFLPAFEVVVVGQTVEMPNVDTIYHNVFSFSKPNDFDLGLYPKGESRSVTFETPGVVKAYCSIHENMNATIVVVPNVHFDIAARDGGFEITDVEPGRYALNVWSERLPALVREIAVAPGQRIDLDLSLADVSR